jgi:hypothetical protein
MNSLATNVLRPRYGEAIRVYERQKSGRIHYHLLVNVGEDIRSGFNFHAIKKHDYRSASAALRAEWAFWRRTSKEYGFGRTELLPVISTAEAVGRYVGKYISKHLAAREERDLGVRLVSYIGPRVATVKFAWAGGKGRDWRVGLGSLVRDLAAMGQIDGVSTEAMFRQFGRRWAWEWKDIIAHRAADSVKHSVPRGTNVENCEPRLDTLEQCGTMQIDVLTGEIYGGEACDIDLRHPGAVRTDRSCGQRGRPERVELPGAGGEQLHDASESGEAGGQIETRRWADAPRGRDSGGGEARTCAAGEAQIIHVGGSL